MKLFLRWMIYAAALILAAYLIPGVAVASFYSALIAALILGLINALIRPLVIILTLPINILSLGIFTFIINALMLWLASTMVKGFYIADFGSALWAALLLWIISLAVNWIFKED
ncbi:MAG: phage holin family protein [Patescibacteria group bacterium]|nr:phage holin family protein [Patescibacteria group bacterium]MDD5490367.1 phage holin family protein [Patescibacteria group bacterium]